MLPLETYTPKGRNDSVRPVIERFDNRRSRDLVYSARRELRNSRPVPTPIYISEQRKVMTYFWNAEQCGKVEISST